MLLMPDKGAEIILETPTHSPFPAEDMRMILKPSDRPVISDGLRNKFSGGME